jgi:ribosomal protein S5
VIIITAYVFMDNTYCVAHILYKLFMLATEHSHINLATTYIVEQMACRSEGDYGAAKVMLRPASPGTGVIAGGAVRIVLEMAGVENALGKQIGSKNALNNARATVVAVQKMRQFSDVARERGIPMEELWK